MKCSSSLFLSLYSHWGISVSVPPVGQKGFVHPLLCWLTRARSKGVWCQCNPEDISVVIAMVNWHRSMRARLSSLGLRVRQRWTIWNSILELSSQFHYQACIWSSEHCPLWDKTLFFMILLSLLRNSIYIGYFWLSIRGTCAYKTILTGKIHLRCKYKK